MALSGMTSNTKNTTLTGLVMYIDGDTDPSSIIKNESLDFAADFAEFLAGKGAKVLVAKAMKSFKMSMTFAIGEITTKALEILYGGTYSTTTAGTRTSFLQKVNAPGLHKFTFKGILTDGRNITIVLNNAQNTEFGKIDFSAGDFAVMPCNIVPIPLVPGDDDEVMGYIDIDTLV
jgi:hypothetical protein